LPVRRTGGRFVYPRIPGKSPVLFFLMKPKYFFYFQFQKINILLNLIFFLKRTGQLAYFPQHLVIYQHQSPLVRMKEQKRGRRNRPVPYLKMSKNRIKHTFEVIKINRRG
jgi:hypothetical protein